MTELTPEQSVSYISRVDELLELHEFMQDDDLYTALDKLMKIILEPGGVPPQEVPKLIVRLQAYGGKFEMLGTIYTGLKKGGAGSENATKKNVYKSASAIMDKLVAALKYQVKGSL